MIVDTVICHLYSSSKTINMSKAVKDWQDKVNATLKGAQKLFKATHVTYLQSSAGEDSGLVNVFLTAIIEGHPSAGI